MGSSQPTRNRQLGNSRDENSGNGNPHDPNGVNSGEHHADKPVLPFFAAMVALLLVACLLMVAYRYVVRSSGTDTELENRLELTRTALAATENLESDNAEVAWSQLFAEMPEDQAVALNRAINRILRVDDLSSRATNASLDEPERMGARALLPDAIAAARGSIEDHARKSENPVIALWLQSRIDLHEASLLPSSMTKSLRREVYQRLAQAIQGPEGQQPHASILGGTLIQVVEQLEDPIDGLPQDLLTSAATTVGKLSDQAADNIYFALRAARLAIETRDVKAAEYVRRASELARAIEPSIRRETEPIGVTPDQLVAQITNAIESGNWPEADNRMLLWFNVLNSTEIVKTDRRRATPHPLDLLSFESLRRLSAEVVTAHPLEAVATDLRFEPVTIGESANVISVISIDFDLDLDSDLISLHRDRVIQLWRNDGTGLMTFVCQNPLTIDATGMISADLFLVDSSNPSRLRADRGVQESGSQDLGSAVRHDTLMSLVVFGSGGIQLIQVDGRSETEDTARMIPISVETGLEGVVDVITAVAGDLEADGDLDLIVSTAAGVRLFANRGNQSFFELTGFQSQFADDDPASDLTIADLDRDLDLDVVSVHRGSGRVGLIENLLHLQFRGRYLQDIAPVVDADSIHVEDVDGNVSWDLIIGGREGGAIVFSQTADAGAWTVDRTVVSDQDCTGMVVADFDNDSWLDLMVPASDRADLCRVGPWGFSVWSPVASAGGMTNLVTEDFDRDGTIDLAGVVNEALAMRLNQTRGSGHHLDVRFRGIDDNATGRVNHYAIGSVLELRFGPHYRARIVRSPSTHFGLDGFDRASSVRAILPNGLTQTIRDPKIDSLVEEEQTLKGSCPYLYAWDGEKFVFKTDCLWAAPLGLQVAHGVVAKDRPWEYLKIDGTDIAATGDHYEFRITEELWEVAYFDHVAVSVVDHPSDVEVWTNEKVGPGNIATPAIFAFAPDDRIPLRAAVDTQGRDVREKLAVADRQFVKAFDHRLRQGLCLPHWIDLDFGDLSNRTTSTGSSASAYLVLTGWILPTDTSLNLQIDQNPELEPLEFPSVWVPDARESDGWRKAIPYMGFPGGKTKTIVVDVSDVIDRHDARFRIRTSAQIYWDQAQLALPSDAAPFREQSLDLVQAEVAFHGFSARVREHETHPESYDYQQATESPKWPPLRGGLTRFGDALELVRKWDDKMVVMGAGDELRLKFSLPADPLPEGWKRDFVVHSVGWDKDADLNTLAGQSTLPLPYKDMPSYPPTADALGKSQQVSQLNQAHLQRTQDFRSFWYRDVEPEALNDLAEIVHP